VSGIIQNNVIAYPQQKQGNSYHNRMMMQPGVYASGTISSLQNDEKGKGFQIISKVKRNNNNKLITEYSNL
jgi:hypothetical protein